MELTEQYKNEHSGEHTGSSDSGQPTASHSLLSIKTLQPWQIPEHCLVRVFFTRFFHFYARQHAIYAIARICQCHANSIRMSVHPSVYLSVCHTHDLYKTAELIIEILSRSDRPIILIFRHLGSLHKSDGFTPNGGTKYKGGRKN